MYPQVSEALAEVWVGRFLPLAKGSSPTPTPKDVAVSCYMHTHTHATRYTHTLIII